jgi:16S rRNA G966 N2-methylase RsmD
MVINEYIIMNVFLNQCNYFLVILHNAKEGSSLIYSPPFKTELVQRKYALTQWKSRWVDSDFLILISDAKFQCLQGESTEVAELKDCREAEETRCSQ